MSEITTVGFDLAKNVLQAYGAAPSRQAVLGKKLGQDQVLPFFSQMPRCIVAMEACRGAHFWGRENVGAEVGKETFGAMVAKQDQRKQPAKRRLRARGVDLGPDPRKPYGPAA